MLALLFLQTPSILSELDSEAHLRNTGGIRRFYGAEVLGLPRDPMAVLHTNGAYGAGKFGWKAVGLTPPGETSTYVVFSTPLTVEDIGERMFLIEGGKLTKYVDEQESFGWAIRQHHFDISFQLAKKKAFLTDTLLLRHEGTSPGELFLRFSPTFVVQSITDLDSKKPVAFSQAGGVVALGNSAGPVRRLKLKYEGTVDLPNYAGTISSRYAMLTDEYWYPMIARQPAPYDATVEVPRGWSVVAQGEKTAHKVTKSGETWTYNMTLPITFFSLSAGAYHTYEQKIGGREFRTWSFRMTPEQSRWQAELYAPILKTYETFAPYPFTGYGAVDQPNYGSGMLEAYSFNTGQQGSYPADEPHEPSHTWFGGMFNNSYLRSFWNESFADWADGFCRRNMAIGSKEDRSRAFSEVPEVSTLFDAAPVADAPADTGPAASSIGYGKGAFVLDMLEDELGTPKMVAVVRRWLASRAHGTLANWEDFEAAVGPEYKWFFDQWLRRPGFPVFTVTDVKYVDKAVTGHVAFRGPAYRMHLDALLDDGQGKRLWTKVDTMESVDGDGFRFHIPCPWKPALVSLDPWLKALRPIEGSERQLTAMTALGLKTVYRDPAHPDYMPIVKGTPPPKGLMGLSGVLLVGNPATMPAMRALCKQAGFSVKGDYLTYRGMTIDLRRSGALAILDLPGGRHCGIALGTSHLPPNTGQAQVAIFDDLGRFLRGETAPKTSGNLTFRL